MVSELLMSLGSSGVMIEDKNDVAINQRPEGQWDIIDEAIAERIGDDVRVTGYYEADAAAADKVAAVQDGVRRIRELNLDFPVGKLEVETKGFDGEDWAETWKKNFHPFRIGTHFVVKPGWTEYDAKPGDKIIEIDPGLAFGTGTHDTTAMCTRLIEKYVKPGDRVIDIGTGTGILAIAACEMGAGSALATDIDELAVKVAAENVKINHCDDRITVRHGDLLQAVDEVGDVVIANIIADVIIMLAEPVRKHIAPGGMFICSGIIRDKKEEVHQAILNAGFPEPEILESGEWCAMAARRD